MPPCADTLVSGVGSTESLGYDSAVEDAQPQWPRPSPKKPTQPVHEASEPVPESPKLKRSRLEPKPEDTKGSNPESNNSQASKLESNSQANNPEPNNSRASKLESNSQANNPEPNNSRASKLESNNSQASNPEPNNSQASKPESNNSRTSKPVEKRRLFTPTKRSSTADLSSPDTSRSTFPHSSPGTGSSKRHTPRKSKRSKSPTYWRTLGCIVCLCMSLCVCV